MRASRALYDREELVHYFSRQFQSVARNQIRLQSFELIRRAYKFCGFWCVFNVRMCSLIQRYVRV